MSGIFGIFNRNGKPIEEKTVDTMMEAMSYWEPDERDTWIEGPVALGHGMLWNTPESKYEHFPVEQNAYVLTMDARVDNRDELAKEIELPDRPFSEIGDSEFILGAYKKWGEECPKHLLGDFAFVIWDEKKQQLFCARDHVGIKPFYYYVSDELFVFSNDIKGLIINPNVPKIINDKAVALYLIEGELYHPTITFLATVQKLPAASTMIIKANDKTQNIYWKAENSQKIRFDTYEEYSQKLQELLKDSVKKRLRSSYPIASHLSGGLDSSTIAVIAARQLHSQDLNLHVYNWVPEVESDDDPDYYEWAYSQRIANEENMLHNHISMDGEKLEEMLSTHDIGTNDTVDLWYEPLLRKKARTDNVRIILSGWGGDELISHQGYGYYAGLFWRGNIISALHGIYKETFKSRHHWKSLLRRCYSELLLPILPESLFCKITKTDCQGFDLLYCTKPEFKLFAESLKTYVKPTAKIGLHVDQLDRFHAGHILSRIESWEASSKPEQMEYRYPLLDKRIVEFSLGIPEKLYRHEGLGRALFRDAVSGILPEDIRLNNIKHEPYRVSKFLDGTLDAQNLWMKKAKSSDIVDFQSKYVDINFLFELIEKGNKLPCRTMQEKIILLEKLENSEKSILLLQFEYYFNKNLN